MCSSDLIAQLAIADKAEISPSEIDTGVAIVDSTNIGELESLIKAGLR